MATLSHLLKRHRKLVAAFYAPDVHRAPGSPEYNQGIIALNASDKAIDVMKQHIAVSIRNAMVPWHECN